MNGLSVPQAFGRARAVRQEKHSLAKDGKIALLPTGIVSVYFG
jgi:hypothetical protein